MGRPSKYTPELGQKVADCIAKGMTVDQAAAETGIPEGTIYGWNYRIEEFQNLFARARDLASDAISYQALRIADDDSIDPAHKRIMVDTRIRILGKWSNRYSEKHSVDHTTKGEKLQSGASLTDDQLWERVGPEVRAKLENIAKGTK